MKNPDTLLFRAIYLGDIEAVRSALALGANPNSEDFSSGLRPIHFAACNGNIEIIQELLKDSRVKADSIDRKGRVPYELASDFGHTELERYLINYIFEHPDLYGNGSRQEVQHHMMMHLIPT